MGAELDHHVADVIGIVTSQTYHRWVLEQRQGRTSRRAGRPKIGRNMRELVTRLARENVGWGYRRIIGEMRKLRLRIGRSSVRRILKEEGLVPAPTRRGRASETPWRKFIRLHVDTLVACDFFTKNIITPLGTRLAFCLAFIHVGTRKVYLSSATYNPNERWVQQQARNLTMWLEEEGLKIRFLLHDRDAKFSGGFRRLLRGSGIQWVRTPLLAADANAFIEAWIGSLKREALDHFLCFGLDHLDHIIREYVRFHNTHRPHQGLGNRTVPEAARAAPELLDDPVEDPIGRIRCQRFLGGLLRHYYRDAA